MARDRNFHGFKYNPINNFEKLVKLDEITNNTLNFKYNFESLNRFLLLFNLIMLLIQEKNFSCSEFNLRLPK